MATLPPQLAELIAKAQPLVDALKKLNLDAPFICGCIVGGLVLYVVYEQVRLMMRHQGKIAGPKLVTPIFGGIIEMIRDPYGFWERQRVWAKHGLSWHSIMGMYMIFVTDTDTVRKVLNENGVGNFQMAVHPNASHILGPKNLAFMHGPVHKKLRQSFVGLFTRKALGVYVASQDKIIRDTLKEWLKFKGEREVRDIIRDMNAYTSQDVFAGPYLEDPVEREKFSEAYRAMTEGFLAFPLCVPGTAVWKGKQGRIFVIKVLEKAAARSLDFMKRGLEPKCLMDFWSLQVLKEMAEADANGEPHPEHCNVHRMADVIMDFLFASQDASTASLTWVMALMADRPDVMNKVREEQLRVRPDIHAPIDNDTLERMDYTRRVVKELLRYRPAAPMVPQWADADLDLTPDVKVKKGTLIMPSLVAACAEGYSNPHEFDPDRFDPAAKNEGVTMAKHFLPFGCGPHYCVGREYAMNHLAVFLAVVATHLNIERRRTPKSDDWLYLPTVYPADCLITMSARA